MKNRFSKNALILVVGFAVAAIFATTLASCDTGSSGGGGSKDIPTSGSLKITGLGSYNGKYAFASGEFNSNTNIIAAKVSSQGAMSAVQISGGSVTLPVYKQPGGGMPVAFDGTGTASVQVGIFNTAPSAQGAQPNFMAQITSVSFTNGVCAGVAAGAVTPVP